MPTLVALTPVIPEPSPMNIPAKDSATTSPLDVIFLKPDMSLSSLATSTLPADTCPCTTSSKTPSSTLDNNVLPSSIFIPS
ncbi:MAG: Uncharacterised protein [Methanobacteriota archaeon]|nr:MAG: Uncharacterised protein [Euryarchaeota archaeon]